MAPRGLSVKFFSRPSWQNYVQQSPEIPSQSSFYRQDLAGADDVISLNDLEGPPQYSPIIDRQPAHHYDRWEAGITDRALIQQASMRSGASMPQRVTKNSPRETVKALQRMLVDAGFNPGKVDGLYGPDTTKAVSDFQKVHGITKDGKAGPQTLGLLRSPQVPAPLPRPRPQQVTMPGVSARVNTNPTINADALHVPEPVLIGRPTATGAFGPSIPAGQASGAFPSYPGSIGGRYAGSPASDRAIVPAGKWQSTEGMGLDVFRPEVPRPPNVAQELYGQYKAMTAPPFDPLHGNSGRGLYTQMEGPYGTAAPISISDKARGNSFPATAGGVPRATPVAGLPTAPQLSRLLGTGAQRSGIQTVADRLQGTIKFDLPGYEDISGAYASGGAGKGAAPAGTWAIGDYTSSSPTKGLRGWSVPTPGTGRSEIMIHLDPRGRAWNDIKSLGCLSVLDSDYPALETAIQKAREQFGPLALTLAADGTVTIRTAAAAGLQGAARVSTTDFTKAAASQVRALQSGLQQAGFNPGTIDGRFGSNTKQAIKDFQRANGLQVDGIAGPQTLGMLRAIQGGLAYGNNQPQKGTGVLGQIANVFSGETQAALARSPITQNSPPAQIKAAQDSLRRAGFNPGPSDGLIGSQTRTAVRAFQNTNGLNPDGALTPATLAKLASAPSPSVSNLARQAGGLMASQQKFAGATVRPPTRAASYTPFTPAPPAALASSPRTSYTPFTPASPSPSSPAGSGLAPRVMGGPAPLSATGGSSGPPRSSPSDIWGQFGDMSGTSAASMANGGYPDYGLRQAFKPPSTLGYPGAWPTAAQSRSLTAPTVPGVTPRPVQTSRVLTPTSVRTTPISYSAPPPAVLSGMTGTAANAGKLADDTIGFPGKAKDDYLGPVSAVPLPQVPLPGATPPRTAPTQARTQEVRAMSAYDPQVAKLQSTLNQAGFRDMNGNRLQLDGIMGNLTRSAFASYQRAAGAGSGYSVAPSRIAPAVPVPASRTSSTSSSAGRSNINPASGAPRGSISETRSSFTSGGNNYTTLGNGVIVRSY